MAGRKRKDGCSTCGKQRDTAVYTAEHQARYCRACHAAYMREWRKTNPMSPEQKRKDNARSYANVYLRRGKIQRQPCKACGHEKAEMHHHDYAKPLEVEWLCRPCHLQEHLGEPGVTRATMRKISTATVLSK